MEIVARVFIGILQNIFLELSFHFFFSKSKGRILEELRVFFKISDCWSKYVFINIFFILIWSNLNNWTFVNIFYDDWFYVMKILKTSFLLGMKKRQYKKKRFLDSISEPQSNVKLTVSQNNVGVCIHLND